MPARYDALVVGSGPNGLAAAICLAQAGCSVRVLEGSETVGGGMRSAELTLPGFVHDICSAVHPLAAGSPFFRTLPLSRHGVEWIYPPAAMAHPFDDGSAAVLLESIEETASTLGEDAGVYERLVKPLAARWEKFAPDILGPFRLPDNPLAVFRFARHAVHSAEGFAARHFRGNTARSFIAGLAAHSMLPLEQPVTAGIALVLNILGHVFNWPLPRGGSQKLADALSGYLLSQGGEIETGRYVNSLEDLPAHRAVLLDVGPRQLLKIAGEKFADRYRHQLENYRYGMGAFKIDWALSEPAPFRPEKCRNAGTLHLGGSIDEIARAERAVWNGEHPQKPFVIFAQPSVFDSSRAPAEKHTAWAYCHVPNGSMMDMTERIEKQVERFAPGFRNLILSRHTMTAQDLERYNPNYVGGDINGGIQNWRQLFTRPAIRLSPYSTPADGIYLCSSSTPPGGGVHGMCGYHAAQAALQCLGGG